MVQHPQIYVPRIKDPYYFDRLYDKGTDWYLRLFSGAPQAAKAVGEMSHDYLFSEIAARRIKGDLPGVRLIACLRSPMDHMISTYIQMYRTGYTRDSLDETVRRAPMMIEEPSYSRHLRFWFDLFGRDALCIQLYDDLRASPRDYARRIFDFLDVSTPEFIDYDRVVNAAAVARCRLLTDAVRVGKDAARRAGMVQLVGTLKTQPAVLKLLYRPAPQEARPKLGAVEVQRLRPYFEDEIERLETLIDRDLSSWRREWEKAG
jgi:hypothetical protein